MLIEVPWKALRATGGRTGLRGSKNVKQNKALQGLKRQSVGQFTFARINSCTIRIDGANKSAVGWLMEVAWPGKARQRWVARVGNRASEPLTLDGAKRAAVTMLRERVKSEPRDWIKELNQIAANEVDRAVLIQERKRWPLDLVGGARKGSWPLESGDCNSILSVELAPADSAGETLQGDDPLEYYADGYPKLPACLDRRAEAPQTGEREATLWERTK